MGPVDLAASISTRGINSTGTSSGSTPSSGAFVRIGLGQPGQSPGLEPLVLHAGQRLFADVLAADPVTGRAILSIAGRHIETQLPIAQPPLQPGDVIRLAVTEMLPDRITLRLEAGATRPAPVAQLDAAAALAQLDLPDTLPLRAALTAMVERGLPLQREAILTVRNAAVATPAPAGEGASEAFMLDAARAAVRLRQDGVPLTPRSLQLGHAAIAGPYAMPLASLLGDLLRLIDAEAPLSDGPEAPTLPASSGTTTESAPGEPPLAALMPRMAPQPGVRPAAVSAGDEIAGGADAAGIAAAAEEAGPAPGSRLLSGDARAALTNLIATPAASSLQRAIEALIQAPEAQLASIIAEGDAGPPQAPRSPLPDASARAVLINLAAAQAASERSTSISQGTSGAANSPSLPPPASAQGDPDQPPLPLSLAGPASPPVDLAGGQAQGTQDARSAALARMVGALATALNDRIELQQLRAAVSLAQQSEAGAVPTRSNELIDGAALPLRVPDAPTTLPGSQASMPLTLSLPFAMGGRLSTLDLTVQPDKEYRGASGAATPAIRASFSVQLERLGTVGADVRLSGATLRCRLRAGSDSALNTLSGAIEPLRARLQHAGFTVDALHCALADSAPPAPPSTLHHVSVDA